MWDFVNRVAREVRKTHPDKFICNCAYGTYRLPPLKIDKLEPNVVVCIVGGRRPTNNKPRQQEELRQLREAWAAKTDNPIMIFENYPFTDRGWYLPSYVPHVSGESINACKGVSQGEDIWLSVNDGFQAKSVGMNHFFVYFTARMYWGRQRARCRRDVRRILPLVLRSRRRRDESVLLGLRIELAGDGKGPGQADAALDLFAAAKKAAGEDSVYARRVGLIGNYLQGLRAKREQLAQKRGPVPKLRLVGEHGGIVVDGDLSDAAWENCPVAATGRMRELQTGRQPIFGTTIKAAWSGGNLYFGIRCDERPAMR